MDIVRRAIDAEPNKLPMVGSNISHYRTLERLGSGGMGEVFLVEDTKLGRQVALKVLHPGLEAEPGRLARFRSEARAVASLNHPNIVTIHSVEESEGICFFTMELVRGKTLAEIIPSGGLPLAEFLDLSLPLTEAVSAAHKGGITHRDLKPANVMVSDEGRVKVLDFGLAKLRPDTWDRDATYLTTEEMTREGHVMGTMPYMSPEQVQGKSVDQRSDIFSLGIILHEMATGERPFLGETSADLVSSLLRDEPGSVADLKAGYPRDLGRIILRCLEKETERRVQTALDVRNELERLKRDVESGAATPARREPAPVARWGGWKWIAATFGMLAGVAALFVTLDGNRVEPPPVEGEFAPRIESLAVLPLENLSGDPDQEYFADGMTEELIACLAQIRALRVISRTSVMRYKARQAPLDEIVRELDVDALVEGTVRRAGDRVRVTVKLIEGTDERLLWSESYDRDLADVLAVQSEVARSIAREIQLELVPEDEARFAATRVVHPQAVDAYLRGRFLANQFTKAGLLASIELFERAVAVEPSYANAYAGLAYSHSMLGTFGHRPPVESFPAARAAAVEALKIDSSLAEAHTFLAWGQAFHDWDWSSAERSFERADELSSGYSHFFRSIFLSVMGRSEEAIVEVKKAQRLDPMGNLANVDVGWIYYFERRYDQAIEALSEAAELYPRFWDVYHHLGMTYARQGKHGEAIDALQEAVRLDPNPIARAMLGHAYGVAGKGEEAREILAELIEESERGYIQTYLVASIYVSLGENDQVFEWLERSLEDRDWWLPFIRIEPGFDSVRSDPRYRDLLRRMNLSDSG